MNRKKILFIARWYPDKNDNMLGLFVQKHARAVDLLNDVTVIYVTADTTLQPGTSQIVEENHLGIHEIRIYFGKKDSEIGNAFEYLKYYRRAVKLAYQHAGHFDITHVHILSRTALPAMWLKFTKQVPYIITEHWSRYLPVNLPKGSYSGRLRRFFTKMAVKYSSGVTTVTQNLAEAMQKLGLKNEYYITPNIADTNDFYPVEKASAPSIKKLIHVSCFDEPAKNIKGIINVVKKLSEERSDFTMEIIGDGKDYAMIREYAKTTAVDASRLSFTGLLTGGDLITKMQNADAFIMFSNYENFPCTIVESLACGVPVISTNVGGIAEHLTADFGTLIAPGDEDALKKAIINILDHPEHFNKTKMREYAEKNFSLQESGKLFDSIYRKVTQSTN